LSGIGAAIGVGVALDNVGWGVFGFAGAEVGSGGSVATGGTNAFVGEGAGLGVGGDVGVGVFGAGVFTLGVDGSGCAVTDAERTGKGVAPGPLTVIEDPAGTDTSTPPALVSTVPEMVTTVVSPSGETVTYESEPARITDARALVRTS
jgi:hypothetical protein